MDFGIIELLEERGVALDDIVECVIYLEEGYSSETPDKIAILQHVTEILYKREVQNAVRTGIALDMAAESGVLKDKILEDLLLRDESLYGIDEVLAYGICNLYGSIALTNFGYIDRVKPGIIGELNNDSNTMCHTHLDDIIGAIAASAASKNAHNKLEVIKWGRYY